MNDTEKRIAEIRQLADAATAGPWIYEPPEAIDGAGMHYVSTQADVANDDPPLASFFDEGTARFVAASRQIVPELLNQLEQARTDLALYGQYEEKYIAQLAKMGIESHKLGDETTRLRAELEHERSLSRRLATKNTAMATAIQRIRDLHRKASHGEDCVYCNGLDRQNNYDCTWPCDTIRALDGETPDASLPPRRMDRAPTSTHPTARHRATLRPMRLGHPVHVTVRMVLRPELPDRVAQEPHHPARRHTVQPRHRRRPPQPHAIQDNAMTTLIPEAAITAAATVLAGIYNGGYDTPLTDWETDARAVLNAAFEHLGQARTEYTTRITRDGRTHTLDDGVTTDPARLRHERHRDAWTSAVIVRRTVWRGEWTEAMQ